MSFFKKLGHSISHTFRKVGGGIRSTFVKAGKDITRGVGSLAGGAGGAALGEGLALAIAPEFAIPAMAVGAIAGRELGKQGAGLAYESLEKKRPQGSPAVQGTAVFQGRGGKTGMRPSNPSVPIKVPKLPAPRPRLGQDGAGQRQSNPIEKSRPPEKKVDMFV